ncbi:MAG: type II secretion system protein [Sedimentisphaerales bacterium]|nr:type II secretion system protein [Sedimentisphaerales bacterium]
MTALHKKSVCREGFTLVELLAVIMIVAILASVLVPLLQGKIDRAKWSEANSTAGTIKTAVSAYVARYGVSKAQADLVGKTLDDEAAQNALEFIDSDLITVYFVSGDYEIISIDSYGHAAVKVTASRDNAPEGEKILNTDGSWQ